MAHLLQFFLCQMSSSRFYNIIICGVRTLTPHAITVTVTILIYFFLNLYEPAAAIWAGRKRGCIKSNSLKLPDVYVESFYSNSEVEISAYYTLFHYTVDIGFSDYGVQVLIHGRVPV